MNITHGQLVNLRILLKRVDAVNDEAQIFVMRRYIGHDLEYLGDLTYGDWQTIRDDAYPNWKDWDWTPGDTFLHKLRALMDEYRETVLGQKRLW